MKKQLPLILVLGAATVFPTSLRAEQEVTNRITVSARFGFNIEARFTGAGSFSAGAPRAAAPRRTPGGDLYNYDDGYVLRDISDNAGGQTWYWGYDNGGQISGNGIQLSRSSSQTTQADPNNDQAGPSPGAEVTFSRQLGVSGTKRYGFEVAANYLNLNFQDRSSASVVTSRTTDTYGFTPGTTPPTGPYQGSYGNAGFVISDTPDSSLASTSIGDSVIGKRNFEADLWGFRLGPYLEFPLGTNWDLSLSAGLAVGILDGHGSWADTISTTKAGSTTRRGRMSDVDVLWGGYGALNLNYRFNEHWSATGGFQFQSLTSYKHGMGGRKMVVDFGESIFLTIGATYTF